MDSSQTLSLAARHHQAGNLREAEVLYRRILEAEPRNPEALHLLGVVALQVGRNDLAVDYIQQALRFRPDAPTAHNNLGIALRGQGKLDDAIASYQQALRLTPNYAEAYYNLANALRDQGKLDEAITRYQQALRLKPDYAEAYNNLGSVLTSIGKVEEAVANIQQAMRLRPDNAEAHNNLGNALRDQGKLEEAIASYQQALRLKPNYADAYNNLGNALMDQGKLDEAITNYQQALRLKPNFDAYYNMGNALTDRGKLDDAIASYQQALRLKPDYAEAHNNMGITLREQGKLAEAVTSFEQALRLRPDNAEAHNNLGNALRDQGRLDEAITSYQQAIRLRPDYAEAHNNMGITLRDQGKFTDAITSLQQALSLNPNHAAAQSELGVAFTELGRIDEAITSFQEAIRLQPKHTEARCLLLSLLRGKWPDADRAALEQRLGESDLKECDRSMILFGLAEVYDAQGEYARAAAVLRQANALSLSLCRQKGQVYNLDENARFIDNLVETFTPAFFERVRRFGVETERPVFVFGLPRSGTTLTEQILAAHSQAFGAGELYLADQEFRALVAQSKGESAFAALSDLQRETVRRIAQGHLDQLAAMNGSAARVVDKMPDNYLYLGLLAVLFPRAKFIHCRRDLRDVAVSCWMTSFRSNQWTNDPKYIAARFREYQSLMEHWRNVLPVPLLEVNYEETVADLAGAARRLVEWCGLDWEPACLKFNEGSRPVRTASKIQVREPVYTRSVARWRNYEREMSDLFAALNPS
jgi:tetratricopeptide (TPR) repeat protein